MENVIKASSTKDLKDTIENFLKKFKIFFFCKHFETIIQKKKIPCDKLEYMPK